jgi:DNA-binding response OmpR family regulator
MEKSRLESHGRKKILIAEDDPQLSRIIGETLEEKGYATHVAADGVDAINFILLSKPDLILLDLDLPRLRGSQICAMLSQSNAARQIPVIVISGSAELVSKLHLFELGVDDYVTKPFVMAELFARISAVMGRVRVEGVEGIVEEVASSKGSLLET